MLCSLWQVIWDFIRRTRNMILTIEREFRLRSSSWSNFHNWGAISNHSRSKKWSIYWYHRKWVSYRSWSWHSRLIRNEKGSWIQKNRTSDLCSQMSRSCFDSSKMRKRLLEISIFQRIWLMIFRRIRMIIPRSISKCTSLQGIQMISMLKDI